MNAASQASSSSSSSSSPYPHYQDLSLATAYQNPYVGGGGHRSRSANSSTSAHTSTTEAITTGGPPPSRPVYKSSPAGSSEATHRANQGSIEDDAASSTTTTPGEPTSGSGFGRYYSDRPSGSTPTSTLLAQAVLPRARGSSAHWRSPPPASSTSTTSYSNQSPQMLNQVRMEGSTAQTGGGAAGGGGGSRGSGGSGSGSGGEGTWSRGSSSRKEPPLRSQTMDDRVYVSPAMTSGRMQPDGTLQPQWGGGAGASSSNSSNSTTTAVRDSGSEGQLPYPHPRAPGLYNQQNHSSPSLALHSHRGAGSHATVSKVDSAVIPLIPFMDDINLGLENMTFEQHDSGSLQSDRDQRERWYSPNGNGQDGAMEIKGKEGMTASVYSLDGAYPYGTVPGVPSNAHSRTTSHGAAPSSLVPSTSPGGGRRRGSQGSQILDAGYGGIEGVGHRRPESVGGYLPYDEPFDVPAQTSPFLPHPSQMQAQMHGVDSFSGPIESSPLQPYYGDGGPTVPFYAAVNESDPRHTPRGLPPDSRMNYPGGGMGGVGVGGGQLGYGAPPPGHLSQPPIFQPQPPHGEWSYEYYNAAAQQNPYYAAMTGQLGVPNSGYGPPGPLNRAVSNVSTASSLSLGSKSMTSMTSVNSGISRSQSSIALPPPSGGPRRSGTTASIKGSMSSSSGPPITKASVDDYRNRIRADPDPEAQFNFAKYLIEAAKKINSSASGDEKSAKKYRDALLAESLKLIKRLATQAVSVGKPAYADAQFFLANCLGNGSLGLQVDHEKAYNLYVQASKQNHSSATYRTAVCNEVGAGTRRDHARAVLFYRKASALGDTAGMYKLAMILLNGLLGQQRNPKDAIAWLKRAAAQADEDNPHALHELGLLYERVSNPNQPDPINSFIPFDPTQARELFTQAGQFGYPPSQFKLGSCYEYGSLTCPVDPRRSIAWYTRAAERGDAESELALSGWYLTGSEGVLKQSDSEAYLWARRAANKGLPKAEYAVGYYSEVGIGVKQDLEEAKRWYMRAAAQGNKRAMQRLTELKKLGDKGRSGPMKKSSNARPTRQQAETECVIS